jgi:hypothetical protein
MKKNNLPKNWLVLNDSSRLFKDTVIKYLNTKYNRNLEGILTNHYYGLYNKDIIAPFRFQIEPNYKSTVITLDKFIELSKPIDEFITHDGETLENGDKFYFVNENTKMDVNGLWSINKITYHKDTPFVKSLFKYFKHLNNAKQYIIDNFKDDFIKPGKYYLVFATGENNITNKKDTPTYSHLVYFLEAEYDTVSTIICFKTQAKAQAYIDLVYIDPNVKPEFKAMPLNKERVTVDNNTTLHNTKVYDKLFTISQIKSILEKEYDKEDVTDIINTLNK